MWKETVWVVDKVFVSFAQARHIDSWGKVSTITAQIARLSFVAFVDCVDDEGGGLEELLSDERMAEMSYSFLVM
jgi:hypothetical protein